MRRAAKLDANHAAIVQLFGAYGCDVVSLAGVGGGCPDLLVGWGDRLLLAEVKAPKGRLTTCQETWRQRHRVRVWQVVDTTDVKACVTWLKQ